MSITILIIIATCIVSVTAFSNQKILSDLIFYPPAVSQNRQYYRFFTCGFIHADYAHLIFNMISLYFFGEMVESAFSQIFSGYGKGLYALMYLLALPVSLLPTYSKNKDNYHYQSLGASGAVSAVIFAGLVLIPEAEVGLIFLPGIGIPGFIFGPLYLIISAYLDKRGGGNINHSAHIWGALFGISFIIVASKLLSEFDVISNFITRVSRYLGM